MELDFENAKKVALQVVYGVWQHLKRGDGQDDIDLLDELQSIKSLIENLPYDEKSLVSYTLPFNLDTAANTKNGIGYFDIRINQLLDSRFPPSHKFHLVNRSRMLEDLARISECAREMQYSIQKSVGGGSDVPPRNS